MRIRIQQLKLMRIRIRNPGILYFSPDVECGGGVVVPDPCTDPARGRPYQACIALMLLVEPGSHKVSIGYIVLQS